MFDATSVFLTSRAEFASDSGEVCTNNNNGGGNCPALVPAKLRSLAQVPPVDQGAFGANALNICV